MGAGTLLLDYTAANTSKLSDTAALTLGAATLQLDATTGATGSHVETVLSTTLNGAASITRGSGSSAVLQMNAITRNAGASVNFGAGGIATTDTTNTNGILGSWATVGGTDFATNSTNAADGLVTAYTGYADVTRLDSGPQVIADDATSNVRLTEGSGSAANVTLGSTTTTINTLNQSVSGGNSAATIDTAGKTLAVNAILAGTGSGALTVGNAANSGTLTAGTAGGELIAQNLSSNALTINSVIANNGSASSLTQSGSGSTVLTATNTYSGNTTVSAGTLALSGSGSFASSPVIMVSSGAVLEVTGVSGGSNYDGTRFALANGQSLQLAGSVNGALGVGAGATLGIAGAGSTGLGTLSATLALDDGSDTYFDLGGLSRGAAINGYDALNGITSVLVDGTFHLNLLSGYEPDAGDIFNLFAFSGGVTDNGLAWDFGNAALSGGKMWDTSTFSSTGSISVTASAVPEPGRMMLLALGVAMGGMRRRRKKR